MNMSQEENRILCRIPLASFKQARKNIPAPTPANIAAIKTKELRLQLHRINVSSGLPPILERRRPQLEGKLKKLKLVLTDIRRPNSSISKCKINNYHANKLVNPNREIRIALCRLNESQCEPCNQFHDPRLSQNRKPEESISGERVQIPPKTNKYSEPEYARATRPRLSCFKCGKICSKKNRLLNHERTLHRFACNKCDRSYNLFPEWVKHMEVHGETYCKFCDLTFPSAESNKHALSHKEDFPSKLNTEPLVFRCQGCDETFQSQVDADEHAKRENSRNRSDNSESTTVVHVIKLKKVNTTPYQCELCNRYFPNITALRIHSFTHGKYRKRSHICGICQKSYMTSLLLHVHIQKHTREKIVHCDEPNCQQNFFDSTALKHHKRNKHPVAGETRKLLACNLCPFKSVAPSSLKGHIARKHTKEKRFNCKSCSKVFLTSSELNSHTLTHTDERPVKCDHCEMFFKSVSHRLAHTKRTHMGTVERKYICEHCRKGFTTQYKLQRHVLIHSSEKPHKCQFCTKGFRSRAELQVHLKIHTREKSEVCKLCLKSFNNMTSLTIHMHRHVAEKFFKCQFCDKDFVSKNRLESHIRSHIQERPIVCKYCPKDFMNESHIREHMKLHHLKEKSYKCDSCGKTFLNFYEYSRYSRKAEMSEPLRYTIVVYLLI